MRHSLVAIMISAVIAGIFTVLSEPHVKSNVSNPAASNTKPAVKGDRLDPIPADNCLFARERLSEGKGCLPGPINPINHEHHPSDVGVVVVGLWLAPSSPVRTTD